MDKVLSIQAGSKSYSVLHLKIPNKIDFGIKKPFGIIYYNTVITSKYRQKGLGPQILENQAELIPAYMLTIQVTQE